MLIENDDPNYVENLIKYGQKGAIKCGAPKSQMTLLQKSYNRKRNSSKLTKLPEKVLQGSVSTKLVPEIKDLNINIDHQVLSLGIDRPSY